jgi:glycine/sarcosine N-methyltransferase
MSQLPEGAADFYDALAPLFDVMTDWDARLAGEGPFLRAMLEQAAARRVLDAACGSGGHALALAKWNYQALGIDVSAGMIALARAKAAAAGQDVPFLVAGLAELPETIPQAGTLPGAAGTFAGPFDAVLCLGNSLPHLLSQEELLAALRGMAAVLRPGGLLITQNLNYDLRWRTQPRFFAAQGGIYEGQEVLVWRFADYDRAAGRIGFNIALFSKGADGWGVRVHTTPQRPLFLADMIAGLEEAGFSSIRSFAGMALPLASFEAGSSPDLVIAAVNSPAAVRAEP